MALIGLGRSVRVCSIRVPETHTPDTQIRKEVRSGVCFDYHLVFIYVGLGGRQDGACPSQDAIEGDRLTIGSALAELFLPNHDPPPLFSVQPDGTTGYLTSHHIRVSTLPFEGSALRARTCHVCAA